MSHQPGALNLDNDNIPVTLDADLPTGIFIKVQHQTTSSFLVKLCNMSTVAIDPPGVTCYRVVFNLLWARGTGAKAGDSGHELPHGARDRSSTGGPRT